MADDTRLTSALALYPLVFRRALHLAEHWQDAEDLAQTVYLKLYPALATLDERADTERGMKAVLLRTTNHAWFDELRRRKARAVCVAPLPDEHPRYAVDGYAACEGDLMVRSLVARLPEMQAVVVRAVYVDGWSMSEWSAASGTPLGTVKTRARLGRLALMEAA